MKKIPFVKYTSHGNNFVIVDEIVKPVLTESEKSGFAYQATSTDYGVGSDNFLVIQLCTPEILNEIRAFRGYWNRLPNSRDAKYIFRMFEPDGKEAFSCGNGLMCISDYLHERYGVKSTRIMTEIPTPTPTALTIGTDLKDELYWANMGPPRRIPSKMVNIPNSSLFHNKIESVNIEIKFAANGLTNSEKGISLKLSGYLVFTGEPHLVVFTENGFFPEKLAGSVFTFSSNRDFGSRVIHQIGMYLNKKMSCFPKGVNINFVRVHPRSEILEYRTFERGINHETQACGTGAIAVSFIAKHLNLINKDKITVWPFLCRQYKPDAQIRVRESRDDYILYGKPVLLFEGIFFV